MDMKTKVSELIALGALCALRRKELKLTQGELAKMAGITAQSTVSRIEKGELNVPFTNLLDLEAALGIPLLALTREAVSMRRQATVSVPGIDLDPEEVNRNLLRSYALAVLRSHHRAEMKKLNLPEQVGPQ